MDHRLKDLARGLGGSFSARVSGLVSPEVTLLTRAGQAFGRLAADGAGGTRLRAGEVSARIEGAADGGFRMATDDAELLLARPSGSATDLELRSGARSYTASLSLLRNGAAARSSAGKEAARVSGSLAGRRYEATFDPEDPAALPTAIFLLQHLTDLRGKAFRTKT